MGDPTSITTVPSIRPAGVSDSTVRASGPRIATQRSSIPAEPNVRRRSPVPHRRDGRRSGASPLADDSTCRSHRPQTTHFPGCRGRASKPATDRLQRAPESAKARAPEGVQASSTARMPVQAIPLKNGAMLSESPPRNLCRMSPRPAHSSTGPHEVPCRTKRNRPMRSEHTIFADLAALCVAPGYIHAVATLCYRDNVVGFAKELTPDDSPDSSIPLV